MSFGEDVAQMYRDVQRGDEIAAVAFLEQLAGPGPALELAIGTGRIALPLAARGIRVDGVDISPAMVDQLRAKPGGDQLSVTIGDFADVPVSGTYRLIFVVWNTLFNLPTQEDQVRCFENVAAHLTDDGLFVVETFVPAFLYRLRNNQHVDKVPMPSADVARHRAHMPAGTSRVLNTRALVTAHRRLAEVLQPGQTVLDDGKGSAKHASLKAFRGPTRYRRPNSCILCFLALVLCLHSLCPCVAASMDRGRWCWGFSWPRCIVSAGP